ncbi:MAG: ABC transporter substrate-binding protein, partial [Ignisphaera sp.]
VVANSVVSPVFPNVYTFKAYEYNVSKAVELLREAGFTNKTLRLLVSTRSPKDVQLAQAIQQYLVAVGINVVIEQVEHTAFLKRVFTDHDFDLAIYGPSPSSLYYALTYWRTNASLNGPLYSNPVYDRLLDEIASELNESRRALLYREAQQILWSDAPAIWLYFENIIVATKPNVKGLQILPFQMLVLDNTTVE